MSTGVGIEEKKSITSLNASLFCKIQNLKALQAAPRDRGGCFTLHQLTKPTEQFWEHCISTRDTQQVCRKRKHIN